MHEPETDPVCGMTIERGTAVSVEYHGVAYRFCDPACAETFRQDPARWVGDGSGAGFVHDHH